MKKDIRFVTKPEYVYLSDFIMNDNRKGKALCYKHRDGFDVLCQRQMMGRSIDCSKCEYREMYEKDMYKYSWTRWAGSNVIPDIRKMWDRFPDIEKIKREIAGKAGEVMWDGVMRREDAQMWTTMALVEYLKKTQEWKDDYKGFLTDVINEYKEMHSD